jgi:hypothetical protein
MKCGHCDQYPGLKSNGLWNGFKDGDTGELVCWSCRATHYRKKFAITGLRNLYSEFPVMGIQTQLYFKFQ